MQSVRSFSSELIRSYFMQPHRLAGDILQMIFSK